MNPYDGKDFIITAIPTEKGVNVLAPTDGSITPARIAGVPRGRNNRYDLDPKNTGNAADYTQGPIIGAEADQLDALRAKEDFSPVTGAARMPLPDARIAADIAPSPSGADTGGGTPVQPPVAAAPTPAPTGPGNDVGGPSDPLAPPVIEAKRTGTVAAPDPAPAASGLTLTAVEHAHTVTLAERVESAIVKFGDRLDADAVSAWHALRALLGHHAGKTA